MATEYNGKILHVDLADGTTRDEELPELIYRRYLGGSGLAAYLMLRDLPPRIDPFSSDNKLVLTTSVITGMSLSGTNRFTAAAKSPLSESYGESEAGGWWGPELKAAGYDGVVLHGRSDKPVYITILDGEVEIRDASKHWGQLSGEVQDGLIDEIGDKRIRVLQTGVSGENRVRYAALVNELKHFNGRCGMGAVMGSKNVKAIVVRGKSRPKAHDLSLAKESLQSFQQVYDRDQDLLYQFGSSRIVPVLDGSGILPTRNFRQGSFEKSEELSGQTMADTILVNRGTCFACAVACKREVAVEELGVTPKYGGPEYETIAAAGTLCGVGDLKRIAAVNQLLAQYVLDSISTGASIAFAMECFENGILTKEETDGLDLRFGNADAVEELVHKIGRREGIGDLLAEGVKRAAKIIGKGAEKFALHVKGQELPMHDPRGKKGLALAYATSPTGADHMEAPHDPAYAGFWPSGNDFGGPLGLIEPVEPSDLSARKVKAFFVTQQVWSLYNAVGMCDFVGAPLNSLALNEIVKYVQACTGWDTSLHELLKAGERANTMMRLFNVREGFSTEDDILPERLFEPLENGALEGESLDHEEFDRALALYYKMAGWDEGGVPSFSNLVELDLEWAAEEGATAEA
ncbi:MAG: aldehyde ferredoxin oxidoreductase family protein [Planctomycetota bacterium]|nr:aldehyde ferredoxin oxidoreductase family protein [Planctomycetota bacterium]